MTTKQRLALATKRALARARVEEKLAAAATMMAVRATVRAVRHRAARTT